MASPIIPEKVQAEPGFSEAAGPEVTLPELFLRTAIFGDSVKSNS